MIIKHDLKMMWVLCLLGVAFIPSACSQSMDPISGHTIEPKDSSMKKDNVLPPIDLSAPDEYETASFGLG